jgi:plasmid replication initiation protein
MCVDLQDIKQMDKKIIKFHGKKTITKNDSDMFLRKHVGLIHCENKLTLIQRKICNILLFNALDRINDQDIHEIPIRQLCNLVGYNSNDTKLIKESIKSLISIVLEWNLLEDSKFLNEDNYSEDAITWNASSLLAGASIKSGVIQYSYSPQIKSVLSSLDIYGRINLFVQSKFNSAYSLVLYENCVRFKNINQTSWFTIELLRSLMGVSKEKYLSFKEFNRNVINIAVKEINKKSDICIQPNFKKSGRNIASVQFLISENQSYQPSFRKTPRVEIAVPAHQQSILMEKLISEYYLSEKQANEIIDTYENEYILQKINLIKAKKNINHLGAYLISALKKDYKDNGKKNTRKITENSYLREAKQASEIKPLKNRYMSYKLKNYINFVEQQGNNIKSEIYDMFEKYLKPNIEIYRLYKKKGLISSFVMTEFMIFIDKNFNKIIGNYLSFDDYITSEETV